MNANTLRSFALMVLMVASAVLAPQLRATTSMADQRPPIDLENMVPRQFGEWREQPGLAMQLVNPEQQATLDRIYSQTLSRTYVNADGYRIMLSIAYGKDQSDALQLHKPEVCYPAQGFQLTKKNRVKLALPERTIPATQLMTRLGQRFEPVTYWTVIGDRTVYSGVQKKFTEMSYSLFEAVLPDGMLVRLSSIDRAPDIAYRVQAEFAKALVDSIPPDSRARFAGLPAR